jgi:signal transduction histidine kinase
MLLGEARLGLRERMCERQAERERIARDLHDTLLQSNQALLFRLQLWTCDAGIPEESRVEISEVVTQVRAMVVECRDRLLGLRRDDRERVDLMAALQAVGSAEPNADTVRYKATCRGERRCLHPDVYDQLLDIGREAIRNAYRHSRASEVVVTMEYRNRSLRMQIADDGCGIDPSILRCQQGAGHFGLIGMRERATQLGSRLLLETNGAAGTRLTLQVPGRVAFLAERDWAWQRRLQESWAVDEAAS